MSIAPLARIGAALLVIGLLVACASSESPSPISTPVPTASATPSPSPSPTPQPSPAISCQSWGPDLLPSWLAADDPCPSAIAAVEVAVRPLAWPIARLSIGPGSFQCGQLWPGLPTSGPICLGVVVVPGTAMYGWVNFSDTEKMAAVQLHREVAGIEPSGPAPSVGLWQARVLAFAVPPSGWTMPTLGSAPTPSPTPIASPTVSCSGGEDAQDPALARCPEAVAAVVAAVHQVVFPVSRISLEPGDFWCWFPFQTGIQPCPSRVTPPQPMAFRGYVEFVGTPDVAVVLVLPDAAGVLRASFTLEVPPTASMMP